MAGAQVIIMANQVEDQRLGKQAISLTHYDDNLEPQIAAGSVVEIGSALFEFSALESITGWAGISNNSDVYIKLTVSGASVTASFTIAAPTWDTAKEGWYSGAERYVFYLRKDGSGNYTKKRLLLPFPAQQSRQLLLNELTIINQLSLPAAGLLPSFVAASGSEIFFAADVEHSENNTTWTKRKEIWIPFSGIISAAFDLRISAGSYSGHGRIYKNNAAVGTDRSTTSSIYQNFAEDITVARGDKLELYSYIENASYNVLVRNFRIRTSTPIAGTFLEFLYGVMLD